MRPPAETVEGPGPLHRFFDTLPSRHSYWSPDLICQFANAAHVGALGLPAPAILGDSIEQHLGHELLAQARPALRAALQGQEQQAQWTVAAAQGTVRHVTALLQPDVVAGLVVGLFITLVDTATPTPIDPGRDGTSDAANGERGCSAPATNLHEGDRTVGAALAGLGIGLACIDASGCITLMNDICERLTGWSPREAEGRPFREVFLFEDASARRLELPVGPGSPSDDARRGVITSLDESATPVELRATTTYSAAGAVAGAVILLRSTSDDRHAKLEANRLAAIVESSHDAIIGKTLDGRITSWNAAAAALFGYSAEEAIGRQIQMLIPEERQDEEMRILASLTQGARVPEFETVRRTKDGSLVPVAITISPIRDAEGRIAGGSKIVRDLTERMKAELTQRAADRLEAQNREIQEATRLKSLFLANMSHELRTPLNAIIGFSELLQAGDVAPASANRYIGHIATSGRHLLKLIDDILDLAKVESGKFDFYPEEFELQKIVGEMVDTLQGGLARKSIRLDVDIEPRLGPIVLDPARFKQIVLNFLSNAIKFTPHGGHIQVRVRPEGEHHFRLIIEDNGSGIPARDLPKLFTEFQQLDSGLARRQPGTGLGLALTKRLAEAQGGRVGVSSVLGQGSVFYAVLNRVHGGPALEIAPSDDRPLRILVIEDDLQLRKGLKQALSEAGFGVELAATASRALELAQESAFDALTLNVQLRGRDGLAMLASLRDRPSAPSIPVLGLTASTEGGHAAAFAIADLLCKPVNAGQFEALLGRHARRSVYAGTVLLIDDDEAALETMRGALTRLGLNAVCMSDGRRALREIDVHRPQAIVVDLMQADFDGLTLLNALQNLTAWRTLPVYLSVRRALSVAEHDRLTRSASRIVEGGGGRLPAFAEHLRVWRTSRIDVKEAI